MSKTVLVAIAHYLPGWRFGGPTRTIANLVDQLGEEIQFRIVTSDHDFGEPGPFCGIVPDRWCRLGKADVLYLSRRRRNFQGICDVLKSTTYDVVYLNSFFRPDFTILPLVARRLALTPQRPWILAPRGELAPTALSIKARKKHAFILSARASQLYQNLRFQASSAFEARDISKALGDVANDIAIAPNLPRPPQAELAVAPHAAPSSSPLRVVLLARLSRMKNVECALAAIKQSAIPIEFDIWGVVEDDQYWEACKRQMAEMPENVRVTYMGPAPQDKVSSILSGYDLMFMPSLSENFGHVIAESLSVGTPVLLSDRTPWRDLDAAGVGWDLPLDVGIQAFRDALICAFKRRDAEGETWRKRVRAYAAQKLTEPETLAASIRLFQF